MYVTTKRNLDIVTEPHVQVTVDDWMNAIYNGAALPTPETTIEQQVYGNRSQNYFETYTFETNTPPDMSYNYVWAAFEKIKVILDGQENLGVNFTDMTAHYTSFSIPKRTGGLRHIDAPNDGIKEAMRKIKDIIERDLRVLPHNNAYAYIKGRCAKDALEVHQLNKSNWFLKLDVKDFFPSFNRVTILHQLKKIYPFCLCFQEGEYDGQFSPYGARAAAAQQTLQKLIDFSLLDNKLPQGTPLSPLLTNILMIPFDFRINRMCHGHEGGPYIYTRYADDILISARRKFDWQEMQRQVAGRLTQSLSTAFKIKEEKTRFGSAAGRNWNLGLMCTADHRITIGHKKKERFRASIHNFLKDFTSGTRWSKIDVQTLMGNINYTTNIEQQWTADAIKRLEEKFNQNLMEAMKQIIKED